MCRYHFDGEIDIYIYTPISISIYIHTHTYIYDHLGHEFKSPMGRDHLNGGDEGEVGDGTVSSGEEDYVTAGRHLPAKRRNEPHAVWDDVGLTCSHTSGHNIS